jgi:hypothetical protein
MKLRDLKPGMVVAVGNTRKIAAWGLRGSCKRAVIVAKGKYMLGYKRRIEIGGTTTHILVAEGSGNPEKPAYPAVVRAQDVIMPWDEYKRECARLKEAQRKEYNKRKAEEDLYDKRIHAVRESGKKLGIESIGPIYKTKRTSMSLNDLEKLITMAEGYKESLKS